MVDHKDGDREASSDGLEQVGRVNIGYGDVEQTGEYDQESRGNQLPAVILAGVIAVLLMIGAMLLILPGVFEM